VLSVSKLETLLRGDVDFRSTNEVEVLIVISLLNARAHSRSYGGGCSSSRVIVGVGVGVGVGVKNWHNLLYGGASKLETLLHGDVNFRSTNEVEVLIVISF
jgi:hypothetical protein